MGLFPHDESEVGGSLGEYEVVRKLATGGMAEIYLARVRGVAGFEKQVVLKRILPSVAAADSRFVEMFLEEARLAATLRHPNIASVFDVGHDHGSYFFAMEYIDGRDAREIRLEAQAAERAIPLTIAVAIIYHAAAALAYAHDKVGPDGPLHLVHRDVSSNNILVSYDGAVKLVDFGIARATSRSTNVTQTGTLKGKIPYMSPEQCQGQRLDRRSDLFSLGTVLYELTTGHRAFPGSSDFAIMEHIVNRDARVPSSFLPGYPPGLDAVVMKLLARDRTARYQTAQDVVADVEAGGGHWMASSLAIAKYMRALFADEIASPAGTARPARELATPVFGVPIVAKSAREPRAAVPAVEHVNADATRPYLVDRAPTEPVRGRAPRDTETDPIDPFSERAAPAPLGLSARDLERKLADVERKLGFVGDDTTSSIPVLTREIGLTSADFSLEEQTSQAEMDLPNRALLNAAAQLTEATRTDRVGPFDPVDVYRAQVEDDLDASVVDGEHTSQRTGRRIELLLDRAVDEHANGRYEHAVVTAELALSEGDNDATGRRLIELNKNLLLTVFEGYLGNRGRQLALARPLEDLGSVPLGPGSAFLLSRIDGLVSIDDLLDVSGMPRLVACRHLCQLLVLGILK